MYDLDETVDMYGNGVVETLEERVAGLLGTEAAAFFPTGTMAQQVALRCWAGRTGNTTVALHPLAHPEVHERGRLRPVSGLRTVHPTSAPAPADRRRGAGPGRALRDADAGTAPQGRRFRAAVLGGADRGRGGRPRSATRWCTSTGPGCGSARPHFGRPLDEIAALADSVYVSFYKSLGGLGGAALAGPKTLIEEARAWRHRYGGQVFQQFPTALAALVGLDRELPRLPAYVAHARVVAAALRDGFAAAGVPWARVHPEVPHTHEFQVWLPYDPDVLEEAALRQAEETGPACSGPGGPAGAPGTGGHRGHGTAAWPRLDGGRRARRPSRTSWGGCHGEGSSVRAPA